jgi:hypothetical protein
MEKDWILVYTFAQMYKAEMLKELLFDQGIEAIIINKKDSSYNDFGDIELYVRRDDILWAKTLIKSSGIE